MVAVLTKMLGFQNLDVAQDIVQDTLLKAMKRWSYGNIPDNPPAWLYTVARNKALDYLRAQLVKNKVSATNDEAAVFQEDPFLDTEIQDSVLRMIFACCHPAIPQESQVALSLKTLCGLSTFEIANAFLISEETIFKRIYRAKEKIKQEGIKLEVPHQQELPARLDTVLDVLYLMFNEGYNSSQPDELIRKDVCAEAMRLCHLLTQHPPTNLPSVNALLSLMCFQSSRLLSRTDAKGNIITLRYQNRATWNQSLIEKGRDYLDRATEEEAISVYHLEAAIAALHASAPSFEQTDWRTVYDLYNILYSMNASPVVALNKAIASAYAVSHQSALDQLKQIKGLERHHLYHAALGEVYQAIGRTHDAVHHFQQAIDLTLSKAEKQLLQEKLQQCLLHRH